MIKRLPQDFKPECLHAGITEIGSGQEQRSGCPTRVFQPDVSGRPSQHHPRLSGCSPVRHAGAALWGMAVNCRLRSRMVRYSQRDTATSAVIRMWACLILCAAALLFLTIASSCARSSVVSGSTYFFCIPVLHQIVRDSTEVSAHAGMFLKSIVTNH